MDIIEECVPENKTKELLSKKRIYKKESDNAFKWTTKDAIIKKKIAKVKSRERLSPRTYLKWDSVQNIEDRQPVVDHIVHK